MGIAKHLLWSRGLFRELAAREMFSKNGVPTNNHIPISADQLILVQNSLGAININSCNYLVIFINKVINRYRLTSIDVMWFNIRQFVRNSLKKSYGFKHSE